MKKPVFSLCFTMFFALEVFKNVLIFKMVSRWFQRRQNHEKWSPKCAQESPRCRQEELSWLLLALFFALCWLLVAILGLFSMLLDLYLRKCRRNSKTATPHTVLKLFLHLDGAFWSSSWSFLGRYWVMLVQLCARMVLFCMLSEVFLWVSKLILPESAEV